jgi:hypothetical protein
MGLVYKSGDLFRLIGLMAGRRKASNIRRLGGWREEVSLVTRSRRERFRPICIRRRPDSSPAARSFDWLSSFSINQRPAGRSGSTRHRRALLVQANFPDL